MRTLAVANHKGGAGKTTTAVCLAGALVERGERILIVDLDGSANASAWLGVPPAGAEVMQAFRGETSFAGIARETRLPGIDVVPGSGWLSSAERDLAGATGAQTLLRRSLAALPERWDAVLLDCPPTLSFVALSALAAAQEILVPVQTRALDLKDLADLLKTIARVRERGLNPDLRAVGIVASRFEARTRLSREILAWLRERYGELVLETTVRESKRIAEAPSHGVPITAYEPDGQPAYDFRRLAAELAERPNGQP